MLVYVGGGGGLGGVGGLRAEGSSPLLLSERPSESFSSPVRFHPALLRLKYELNKTGLWPPLR